MGPVSELADGALPSHRLRSSVWAEFFCKEMNVTPIKFNHNNNLPSPFFSCQAPGSVRTSGSQSSGAREPVGQGGAALWTASQEAG